MHGVRKQLVFSDTEERLSPEPGSKLPDRMPASDKTVAELVSQLNTT